MSMLKVKSKFYCGELCRDGRPETKQARLQRLLRRARTELERHWRGFLLAALGLALLCVLPAAFVGRPAAPVYSNEGVSLTFGVTVPNEQTVHFTRRELLLGALLTVSPSHPLPADFPGANARAVRQMVGSYLPAKEDTLLRPEAVYALCDLQAEHKLDGLLTLTDGALSFAQQNALRRAAFERYLAANSPEDALTLLDQHVQKAGQSEHQTGLCVDIELTPPLSYASPDPLSRTDAGLWLKENLWRFGFVRRYSGAEGEQGGCENLHLRYVGRIHAAAMRAGGWTLETYLTLLRTQGPVLVKTGQETAYVFALYGDSEAAAFVPKNAQVTASADNEGWTIVTAVLTR